MSAIFISYTRKDIKEVDKLEELLIEAGYTVLRDQSSIVNGKRIPDEILRMIGSAQYFLLCHSSHVEKAPWVNWECGIATERARTGKLEMKIIRLDQSKPEAHHSLSLYHDLEDLFEEKSHEIQKAKIHSILKDRRKFWVIQGSFQIAVAVMSLAVLILVSLQMDQKVHTQSQLALWSQTSRKGDNIGRAFNHSLDVTAQAFKLPADSTLLLRLKCVNKGTDEKLFIAGKTYLESDGNIASLQYLLMNGNKVSFDDYAHVLIGEHLKDKEWVELTLVFKKPKTSQFTNPVLHFHFRKSTYGFGQHLELKIDD